MSLELYGGATIRTVDSQETKQESVSAITPPPYSESLLQHSHVCIQQQQLLLLLLLDFCNKNYQKWMVSLYLRIITKPQIKYLHVTSHPAKNPKSYKSGKFKVVYHKQPWGEKIHLLYISYIHDVTSMFLLYTVDPCSYL